MTQYEEHVVPSLWDRLLDDKPDIQRENLPILGVKDMKSMVLRDLIQLFNARRYHWHEIDKQSPLQSSLMFYGLPDINSLSGRSSEDLQIMSQEMERLIKNFEPRLSHARVKMLEKETGSSNLKFLIEADLNIDPSPVPIQVNTTFETTLERFTD